MATEAGVCAILNTFLPSFAPAIIGKDAKMKSHPWSLRGARPSSWQCVKVGLLVEHDVQERSVGLKTAVVVNETELPELISRQP